MNRYGKKASKYLAVIGMLCLHTVFLKNICSALLQNRKIRKDCHNLQGMKHCVITVILGKQIWHADKKTAILQFKKELKGL